MCFSATASFTASLVLSAGGIIAVSKAKSWHEIPIASIPLIFGIQQGLEGIVWITTPANPAYYLGMYGYLFCAYVVWPVLVPWALLIYERNLRRNPPLLAIATVGTAIGAYFLFELMRGGITSQVVGHSICYSFWPSLWYGIGLSYIFVVVLAGLIAKERFMKIFSIGLALSFMLSRFIADYTYVSLWCFFGALLSSVIVWHFVTDRAKS